MNTDLLRSKLDGMTRKQKLDLIQTLLSHEVKRNSPDEFRAFVVGLLGNFVNNMSDQAFNTFCEVHRCDYPDCDCHVIAGEAAKFFKLLREDVKKEMVRRNLTRN